MKINTGKILKLAKFSQILLLKITLLMILFFQNAHLNQYLRTRVLIRIGVLHHIQNNYTHKVHHSTEYILRILYLNSVRAAKCSRDPSVGGGGVRGGVG